MIRLFDIQNGTVIPTEHCYTIQWLKDIMDEFPDKEVHTKIYAYIFYMTCPNQQNPYYNVPEHELEEIVIEDLNVDFDTENEVIQTALVKANALFETPTVRAYRGVKKMLDNLSDYMGETKIIHGRDGNISALIQAAKNLPGIRDSFKGLERDLAAEQETKVRGDKRLGYDQMNGTT